ncbi:hypothetical protein J2X02_002640 [Pseudoxanthomonas japonensis]|nr:hypothetical protein [Pseudoxanthomonas japonensis]MDR7069789.1 hypothetical protein [Pseudoxanthomonas japonensis]
MLSNNTLSFTEMDRRLREMPDGPNGILNSPPLFRVANVVGVVACVVVLMPIVLAKIIPAAPWMLTMVQIGFAVMLLAWLPAFVRNCWVLFLTIWHWRKGLVEQLDHDRPEFEAILAWLCQQQESALIECKRMVALTQRQLLAKIGLLAGGLDRLGILPALAAAYLFLRNVGDILEMPAWQLLGAIFLILLWLIITMATLMRIRLQLYESLLTEALAMKSTGRDTP